MKTNFMQAHGLYQSINEILKQPGTWVNTQAFFSWAETTGPLIKKANDELTPLMQKVQDEGLEEINKKYENTEVEKPSEQLVQEEIRLLVSPKEKEILEGYEMDVPTLDYHMDETNYPALFNIYMNNNPLVKVIV